MYEAPVNLEHDRLLGRDSPRVPCLDNRPTYAPEREASMGTCRDATSRTSAC